MTGLTQLLNISQSGLEVATQAMQTVSNNTANVNTPGYSVESIDPVALPGGPLGGNGAQVTAIKRGFDRFVYQQFVQATSSSQAAQINQTNAQNLSTLFPVASGGANGLGAALSSFFTAVNQLARDPTSGPDRSALLSNAQSLAADFNRLGDQLSSQLRSIDSQASSAVQQVNQLTQQIADLNAQIAAQSATGLQPGPGLLDNRDALIQQLSQQLGLTILPGNNNAVDIYTSGGASLVHGNAASQLVAGSDRFGDGSVAILYAPTGQDVTNSISGGVLGGLASSRAQTVATQDSVGALAAALASGFNNQQSLGLDLNGNLGAPLFSVVGPQVLPASSNIGSGSLSAVISSPNGFSPTDFVLTKTATGFTATDLSTGQATTLGNGPTLNLDGMTITISGTVATGDQFKLEPTSASASGLTVALTNPASIAAAAPYVVTAGNNAGTVQATASGAVSGASLPPATVVIPASQFGQSLSIKFDSATTFQVLSSSNTVLASGSYSPTSGAEIAIAYPSPPTPAGMVTTVTLAAGTVAVGDNFSVTQSGSGDNGNVASMANLAMTDLLSGQTLADNYSALVTNVGTNGQAASIGAQAAQAVFNRAQAAQQSVSGVNLDEQAANLVNYQQAYQASAAVIATVQTLFQSLLQAVG